MPTSMVVSAQALVHRLQKFWQDDAAASAVEYAAVVGLGALGAVSASRALEHNLAYTFARVAAAFVHIQP